MLNVLEIIEEIVESDEAYKEVSCSAWEHYKPQDWDGFANIALRETVALSQIIDEYVLFFTKESDDLLEDSLAASGPISDFPDLFSETEKKKLENYEKDHAKFVKDRARIKYIHRAIYLGAKLAAKLQKPGIFDSAEAIQDRMKEAFIAGRNVLLISEASIGMVGAMRFPYVGGKAAQNLTKYLGQSMQRELQAFLKVIEKAELAEYGVIGADARSIMEIVRDEVGILPSDVKKLYLNAYNKTEIPPNDLRP